MTGAHVSAPFSETFLYRPDGSPLELLYQKGGTVTRYWYVLDGRGDVVALTDQTGKVVNRYYCDAWGAPIKPFGNDLRWRNGSLSTTGSPSPTRCRGPRSTPRMACAAWSTRCTTRMGR